MVPQQYGTLYFDASGAGYLISRGIFVGEVGLDAHRKFVKVFDRSGITKEYSPIDVVNKLVASFGLVVVQVSDPESDGGVMVVSRTKKSPLNPEQYGRVEDTFELSPNEQTIWTDALKPDGKPSRVIQIPARVSIYGSHEYRQADRKDKDDDESADQDYREFEKTVRPEPRVASVQPPSQAPTVRLPSPPPRPGGTVRLPSPPSK